MWYGIPEVGILQGPEDVLLMYEPPYRTFTRQDNYPYNFDISERVLRPPTGIDHYPFRPLEGTQCQGFAPLLDALSFLTTETKTPYGVALPVNESQITEWILTTYMDIELPGLSKVDS